MSSRFVWLCSPLRRSLVAAPVATILVFASVGGRTATSASVGGAAVSGSPAAGYRIDAGQSHFTVHVGVGGLLSGFAHNHNIAIRNFTGNVEFSPDSPKGAMNMTIEANSLAVIDKVSDKDRQEIEQHMRDEVLETSKYSQIVFRSTDVSVNKVGEGQYQAKIFGDLTLHGVTRHGLINAQLEVNGNTIKARGEFPLRQTEYGIKLISVAGGTVKVKDELKFNFDIVANRG